MKFLCVFKSTFVVFDFTFVFVIVFCMFCRLFPALCAVSYLHLLQLFFLFRWKKWHLISTQWPRFGNIVSKPYLITYESESIFALSSFTAFNIPELPCGAIWSQGLYSPIISFCGTAKLSDSEQLYIKSTCQ